MSVYSASELAELSTQLSCIEDWLREDCSARRAEDAADVVGKALAIIEDLHDEQYEREHPGGPS